jgi:hypothetical protein
LKKFLLANCIRIKFYSSSSDIATCLIPKLQLSASSVWDVFVLTVGLLIPMDGYQQNKLLNLANMAPLVTVSRVEGVPTLTLHLLKQLLKLLNLANMAPLVTVLRVEGVPTLTLHLLKQLLKLLNLANMAPLVTVSRVEGVPTHTLHQ